MDGIDTTAFRFVETKPVGAVVILRLERGAA